MRNHSTDRKVEALFVDGPIDHRAMLAFLHEVNRVNPTDVEIANSILPDAGDYLGMGWLNGFIRAELSDDEAKKEIARQRILVERLCELFPHILSYLRLEQKSSAKIVLHIVYDCCSDYDPILASGRKDSNRNRLIAKIEKALASVKALNANFQALEDHFSYAYQETHKAYYKYLYEKEVPDRRMWELKNELKFLETFSALELHRARREADHIRVADNQARTHIVDTVYGISLSYNGPPLVTTPGSDFSVLCSLVFEIATGKADESLAGAISRYARSELRAEADRHEVDYGPEADRLRDEDNFCDRKEAAQRCRRELEELKRLLADPDLPADADVVIKCEILAKAEQVEQYEKQHGPFIIWASQMKVDWEAERRWREEITERNRQLDIAIGKEKRSKRASS